MIQLGGPSSCSAADAQKRVPPGERINIFDCRSNKKEVAMYFDQIKPESMDYPISRTEVLPEGCTLAFLHLVIQRVFGWLKKVNDGK